MNDSYQNDPRITDYVLDAMTAPQREAFEQELAGDPRLAEEVKLATEVTDRLQALYAAEATGGLSADRHEAIFAAAQPDAAAPQPASVAPQISGVERSWLSIATLVVPLLMLVAILLYAARQSSPQLAESEPLRSELIDEQLTKKLEPERQPPQATPVRAEAAEQSSPRLLNESQVQDAGPQPAPADSYALGAMPPAPANDNLNTNLQTMGSNSGQLDGAVTSQPTVMFDTALARGGAIRASRQKQLAAPYGWRVQNRARDDASRGGAVALDEQMEMGGMDMNMGMNMGMGMGSEEMMGMDMMDVMGMDMGMGPGMGGDQYAPITDNPFQRATEHPLSTFSIDVDTASYSKVRSYLQQNSLPRPDAVRIEELINYFDYQYSGPGNPPSEDAEQADEETPGEVAPFKADVEIAGCPWTPEHRLVRVGIKGREIENENRPASNLVFLLDVSGSMNNPNKLPLVKRGMQMLLDQLGENDRVAIVVYASASGLVLDSTPANQHAKIFNALERLSAGGSTNGGDGIRLAYSVARDNFIEGGVNRVLLCTDGDFNVGTTGTDELVRLVEQESKGGIFVSVLGFGMGNHNDSMLEQISNKGNGNYAFIDTAAEAHKVFVKQTNSTLVTIAKDVKIQVEFNPQEVAAYRLIGYENRILAKEDFNDDTVDAGEIGAGHTVTALYEVVPTGEQPEPIAPAVDELRYQKGPRMTKQAGSGEMLTLKLRYKLPDDDTSSLLKFPVRDADHSFGEASEDFQFASAVAGFGMQLRNSPYKGQWTLAAVTETAESAVGEDAHGLRTEFVELVKKAATLKGETQP
ncbi:VWA domain-containing protein [Roseimaritima ulvae]|uniref:von Willebrand factor n=1 Tax=Roseimaritima ulvae TaxID=980254 RepID=A0A5B9QQH1_9BACT|nr:VWA domain-containing protein [Roseimaritima ulvae]QEG41347.1 von Willebrand factor [Roseimaritima ulvae]